jgi:hypothetical protein
MVADPWVRALKVFVIVAAVVILAGSGTLLWLLATGVGRDAPASAAPAAAPTPASPAPATATPPPPVLADLPLPAGAAILDLVSEQDRIVLLLRTPGGQDYLAVIDAATGTRRALLRIVPEKP